MVKICKVWNMTLGTEYEILASDLEDVLNYFQIKFPKVELLSTITDSITNNDYTFIRCTELGATPWIYEIH